ncbi:MAG TPA: glycosyltransferase family 2 protein [Chryseosolibacter sp.]|nr:glycosyltransferase family 2 protein [Chryseosolibacter sp.]
MAHFARNPSWIDSRLLQEKTLEEIPESFFEEVKKGLGALESNNPIVSVVIPAFNEEASLLKTLWSLSKNKTTYPVEIIVVNNNSTDRTQEVLDRVGVRSFFQPVQGWGPARQMGLEKARGKYILSADADCIYPERWIQKMTDALLKDGVVCVHGGYRFLAPYGKSRLSLFAYETIKGIIVEIRNIKRPWFNCGGASMGYPKDLALKIGFVLRQVRGEDGRMAFELAQRGKLVRVRSSEVTVWTSARSLQRDGSLMRSFLNRVKTESGRLRSYLRKQEVHDTHLS